MATLSDDHIQGVADVLRDMADELDNADYALRRRVIEALNITGEIGLEDGRHVFTLHWYKPVGKFYLDSKTFGSCEG